MNKKNQKEDQISLLKSMLTIRKFEEKVDELFSKGMIHGTAHYCTGQEAIAVGACSVLKEEDLVTSTHRGHGHAIAKGLDLKKFMAELMGKESGYCRGKGGTQHNAALSKGFLTNGITAGNVSIATGAALAFRYKRLDRVVICFFGDGAVNEGNLQESINMASLWKLPIIYVCENNLYAMSTPVSKTHCNNDIAARMSPYNIPCHKIDGMDIFSVREAAKRAVDLARAGKGPSFLECITYRFCGHSKNDQREYRPKEEEEEWQKKDPIGRLSSKILNEALASPEDLDKIDRDINREVEDCVKFAQESGFIDKKELMKGIYAQ